MTGCWCGVRTDRLPGAGGDGRERHVRCTGSRRCGGGAAGSLAADGQLRLPMSSGDAAGA